MLKTSGYAALSASSPLVPFHFERREPGPREVLIEILYAGICHSDIHQARNEWGGSVFPMVPGHEIAGRVLRTGSEVTRFKPSDAVGVGCFVDSCRKCGSCREGLEQYCDGHISFTYNGTEQDMKTPTYGGYSSHMVVDENYVLKISPRLPLEKAAPLLCAGITTYSPLRHFKVGAGQTVGIVGMGGLGHMGVKFAAAMGARVTVFSTTREKEKDARSFGACDFVLNRDPEALASRANSFDFILDTVSAPHDLNVYLNLLRRDGTMTIVGVPVKPAEVHAFSLILKRRRLAASLIGGIRETQEMLDYCAEKNIAPEVEIISVDKVNEAYERTIKADVRYRFVMDMRTLRA
ncbi:MAG: NAD(P)-dependent alcohol dehydrogenase [Candidatus Omnitrophica bacterium]|nr:NAD(P)-dependent alcohol dehydrogenase [Candidatus Omnitrophota bacterium]